MQDQISRRQLLAGAGLTLLAGATFPKLSDALSYTKPTKFVTLDRNFTKTPVSLKLKAVKDSRDKVHVTSILMSSPGINPRIATPLI